MFCEDKKCPLYIECVDRVDDVPYCALEFAKLAITDVQHLRDKIAACVDKFSLTVKVPFDAQQISDFLAELKQLSITQ